MIALLFSKVGLFGAKYSTLETIHSVTECHKYEEIPIGVPK